MKVDCLVVWPRAFDFPLWRGLLKKNWEKFNQVLIVCTENAVYNDLRPFFTRELPFAQFIPGPLLGGNWYDLAVNAGLNRVNGDYVFFWEPDFIFKDGFLDKFLKEGVKYDFACLNQQGRFHLACYLGRTDLINKTLRFFAPVGDKWDCFDLFTGEMHALSKSYTTLDKMGFNSDDFYHLNGLSQNLHLLSTTGEPNYQPERFWNYIQACWDSGVKLSPEFISLTEKFVRHD